MSFSVNWIDVALRLGIPHRVEGDRLILKTIRSEFNLLAVTPITPELLWFVGFYMAEGVRRKRFGLELGNKSRVLLDRSLSWFESIGVGRERCKLYVLYGRAASIDAVGYYAPLGVEMAPRATKHKDRAKQHEFGAQLVIKESSSFVRVLNEVVTSFDATRPEWSQDLLAGFLAGDGTVTLSTTDSIRAFCATNDEAGLVASWLYRLNNSVRITKHSGCFVVETSATPFVAVDLLEGGFFKGSMSRVRLFHIAQRLHNVRKSPASRRWGYLDTAGNPTPRLLTAQTKLVALDDEWRRVRAAFPTPRSAVIGRKGALFET